MKRTTKKGAAKRRTTIIKRAVAVEPMMTTTTTISAHPATRCDKCHKPQATLYDRGDALHCIVCVPWEEQQGVKAARLARTAVTGAENIKRRRNVMERREAA